MNPPPCSHGVWYTDVILTGRRRSVVSANSRVLSFTGGIDRAQTGKKTKRVKRQMKPPKRGKMGFGTLEQGNREGLQGKKMKGSDGQGK